MMKIFTSMDDVLITKNAIELTCEGYEMFGTIEMLDTSDLQLEFIDVLQDSTDVFNCLTCEKAGFIDSVKSIFDKIIKAVLSALKFIAKVILFPFKIIFKVLTKRKTKVTPGMVLNMYELNTCNIKNKINGFSDSFYKSIDNGRDNTYLDTDILKKCAKEVEVGKQLYKMIIDNRVCNKDELDSSLEYQYTRYLDSLQEKQEELSNYMDSKEFLLNQYAYDAKNIESISGNTIDSINKIMYTLKAYSVVQKNAQENVKQAETLIKELENLKSQVEKMPNLSDESSYPNEIAKQLNVILNMVRFNIFEVAKRGNNISKWFLTADKIVSEINHLIKMENLTLCTSEIFDQVSGIPVYVNDSISLGWAVIVNNIPDATVIPKATITTLQELVELSILNMSEELINSFNGDIQKEFTDKHNDAESLMFRFKKI